MLFLQSRGYVSSPKQWFVVETFLMEIAYTRNEHLCACFLMNSEDWIGSFIAEFEYGLHLNFVWKQRMFFRALLFHTCHAIGIFRDICASMGCAKRKSMFLGAKLIDVLYSAAVNVVFAFSSMLKRRAINGYCRAFVCWPCSFVCLRLLTMVDSSGWRHSFVRISTKWVQRGGRYSPSEWGWSECCH